MSLEISLIIISIYLLCGLLFAVAFVIKEVEKVDEAAKGASVGFRLMIIPGTVIFWPWLLKKWIKSPKTNHYD